MRWLIALIIFITLIVALLIIERNAEPDYRDKTWFELNEIIETQEKNPDELLEAEKSAKIALEKAITKWGAEHVNVVESLMRLAEIYVDQKNYYLAEENYVKAIEITGKTHGKTNPIYTMLVLELAYVYRAIDQLDVASTCYLQVIDSKKKISDYPNISDPSTFFLLIDALTIDGQYDRAIELCKNEINIRKSIWGVYDHFRFDLYNYISRAEENKGNIHLAREYRMKALDYQFVLSASDTTITFDKLMYFALDHIFVEEHEIANKILDGIISELKDSSKSDLISLCSLMIIKSNGLCDGYSNVESILNYWINEPKNLPSSNKIKNIAQVLLLAQLAFKDGRISSASHYFYEGIQQLIEYLDNYNYIPFIEALIIADALRSSAEYQERFNNGKYSSSHLIQGLFTLHFAHISREYYYFEYTDNFVSYLKSNGNEEKAEKVEKLFLRIVPGRKR